MRLFISFLFLSFLLNWGKEEPLSTTSCACDRQRDSLALVALYESTGGENWTYTTSSVEFYHYTLETPNIGNAWDFSQQMSSWHGVELDESGCVTNLILNSCHLSGNIPSELGDLKNLRKLYLYDNRLIGSIPSEFGQLSKLTELILSVNGLNDITPIDLMKCSSLRVLGLAGNELSGDIPNELFQLDNLEIIDLSGNQLNGEIPSEVGQLSNLIDLRLWGNKLNGKIPIELTQLSKLKILSLDRNSLSGAIPVELVGLPYITYLGLSDNQLSGCFNEQLSSICYLNPSNEREPIGYNFSNNSTLPWQGDFERFCKGEDQIGASCDDGNPNTKNDVITADCECRGTTTRVAISDNSSCRIRDSLVLVALYESTDGANWKNTWDLNAPMENWYGVKLSDRGCLVQINLADNQLSGRIPTELGQLSNLRGLFLHKNNLSGSIPTELSQLSNLTRLSLDSNKLSGRIPSALGQLSNLRGLFLYNNNLSGPIPSELGQLRRVEVLMFGFNQLSGIIPTELGQLSNLTRLSLGNNKLSGRIPSELEQLSNLTSLRLQNNQLSGCYDNVWSTLCNSKVKYDFKGNPALPWQGDFKRFCKGETQVGAPCDDGNDYTKDDRITDNCTCNGILIKPDLVINKHRFIIPEARRLCKRQEKITLQVEVENIGDRIAEDVIVQVSYPDKVDSIGGRHKEIASLSVGEVLSVEFDFFARSFYELDTLDIKIAVWNKRMSTNDIVYAVTRLNPYDEFDALSDDIANPSGGQGRGPQAIPFVLDDVTIRWDAPDWNGKWKDRLALRKYPLPQFDPKLYVKSKTKLKSSDFQLLVNGEDALSSGRIKEKQVQFKKMKTKDNMHAYLIIYSDLELQEGKNELILQVKDATSQKVTITFLPPKQNLHLYTIGVPYDDLEYTTKDAQDFYELFSSGQQSTRLFKSLNTTIDTSMEQTTGFALRGRMEDVSNQFDFYETIEKKDIVMLFISSHGYVDKESGKFYIIGSDYDENEPTIRSTGLDFATIYDELNRIKNCEIIVFIDACYSAEAEQESSSSKLANALIKIAKKIPDYSMLLSCSPDQKSYEDEVWQNGAFTEALLEAFQQGDSDGNGIIEMNEVYTYVQARVPELVQEVKDATQTPYMSKAHQKREVPLYLKLD